MRDRLGEHAGTEKRDLTGPMDTFAPGLRAEEKRVCGAGGWEKPSPIVRAGAGRRMPVVAAELVTMLGRDPPPVLSASWWRAASRAGRRESAVQRGRLIPLWAVVMGASGSR